MARGTPATVALQRAGAAFKILEYGYDPNSERTAMQAAEALGISSSTADRYWAYARAWLHAELKRGGQILEN